MSYVIRAIIGTNALLAEVARSRTSARLRPLDDQFGLIPLVDDLYDEVTSSSTKTHPYARLEYLSNEVAEWLCECSHRGPLAYVEAEYFGGVGAQSAIVFDEGRAARGPSTSEHIGPINDALRAVGVERSDAIDEFDTVRLGRHRHLERWLLVDEKQK